MDYLSDTNGPLLIPPQWPWLFELWLNEFMRTKCLTEDLRTKWTRVKIQLWQKLEIYHVENCNWLVLTFGHSNIGISGVATLGVWLSSVCW